MTPAELIAKHSKQVTFGDDSFTITKLGAIPFIEMRQRMSMVKIAPEGAELTPEDEQASNIAAIEAMAFIASKCIVAGTDRPFDNEPGRKALEAYEHITDLGTACMEYSGLSDQKKS